MFVKNNNILFCLDDCLLCFEIGETCVLLHMHMESGLFFFKACHHKMELQLSCSPFFAVMFFLSG